MFLWFFVAAFIYVRVIKSSMNYEFGSDRRKRTVRLSVFAATIVAIIIHFLLAAFAIGFLWPNFLLNDLFDNSVADRGMSILIIASGTLIWGYLVPKVAFSFVGTKPVNAGENGERPALR